MTTVSLQEAQQRLAELVDELALGGEVLITRDDRPVAKLVGQVPSPAPPRNGRDIAIRLNGELDRLARLAANWDAQGAEPISPQIIAAARQFISKLSDNVVQAPAVVPMGKGNLQFEWNDGPRSLEIEFETPTTIHYLKWHPEVGVEDEGNCDIGDIDRSLGLIEWFQQGVSHG